MQYGKGGVCATLRAVSYHCGPMFSTLFSVLRGDLLSLSPLSYTVAVEVETQWRSSVGEIVTITKIKKNKIT